MTKSSWIREIRKALGLKGFQLAERMQVSAARVSVMEKDEARGAVTLKMMEKAAKAMGCRFEYRIVPVVSLQGDNRIEEKDIKPRFRVVSKQ